MELNIIPKLMITNYRQIPISLAMMQAYLER